MMICQYVKKSFPQFDEESRPVNKPPIKKECVLVRIDGETFKHCQYLDEHRVLQFSHKTGAYGSGFYKNTGSIGLWGEAAAGVYFGLPSDWSYNKKGDSGYDFLIVGQKVDVKTARSSDHSRNFIRRVWYRNGRKKEYPLDADFYIGAYVDNITTASSQGYVDIILVGFTKRKFLEERPLQESPIVSSHHQNTEMFFFELFPMRSLLHAHQRFCQSQSSLRIQEKEYAPL